MKIINVTQGSPEWLALRAQHNTASEAPAMMGASKLMSRGELMRMKAIGNEKEHSRWVLELFARGHATEAAARPLVEAMLGEDLFPVTAISDDGMLLASFDGVTMAEETLYEHKLWNEALAEQVRQCNLDPHYYWQLEQQLWVAKAKKVIFVCSDGTPDNFVSMDYTPVPGRAEQLIAGWKQFDEDRANYQHVEVLPAAVATPIQALPALSVALVGEVTASNLALYRATAMDFIAAIKTDLQTDQDFADAENMVKFCDSTEKELDTVKRMALAQTSTIDELFRTIDSMKEAMKAKRLMLDKLVKARKEQIRAEIVQNAGAAMIEHLAGLNKRLGKSYMPTVAVDFAGAVKGKRTITSLNDAVDTELARAKLAANAIADKIQINLAALVELASDFKFLFSDAGSIVLKENDDCRALVENRIAAHKAEEQRKEDAQRERIRAEEQAKAERELREKLVKQEQEAQAAIEQARQADSVATPLLNDLSMLASEITNEAVAGIDARQAIGTAQRAAATTPVVTPMRTAPTVAPSLKLGQIGERLGFTLTADFLKTLGFEPAATDRASKLYHEADFPHICAALVSHIEKVQTLLAA